MSPSTRLKESYRTQLTGWDNFLTTICCNNQSPIQILNSIFDPNRGNNLHPDSNKYCLYLKEKDLDLAQQKTKDPDQNFANLLCCLKLRLGGGGGGSRLPCRWGDDPPAQLSHPAAPGAAGAAIAIHLATKWRIVTEDF